MNTEELRAAMRGATTDLEPRPSLTKDVLVGGARRKVRRRITLVAVAAVAATAAIGTSVVTWQSVSIEEATDPRLLRPTGGDLARDNAFMDQTVRLWQEDLPTKSSYHVKLSDKVVGRPHVYWAGTTPEGPVAFVLQRTKENEVISGVVAKDSDNRLSVLITVDPGPGNVDNMAYRLGPQGRTVVVLDEGKPLFLSDKVTYDSAGKAQRTWRPMAASGGVAIAQLPEGTGEEDPRVLAADPATGVHPQDVIWLHNLTRPMDKGSPGARSVGLEWAQQPQSHMMWAHSQPAQWNDREWISRRFHDGLRDSGLTDPADILPPPEGMSSWYVSVGTGGHTTIVGEYTPLHSGPPRLYSVQVDSAGKVVRVLPGGPAVPKDPLPVLATIGELGRVAASKGATLSYGTGPNGPWQGQAAEAIVVPPNATHVKVDRPGAAPAIVDIRQR